jgi:putative transcriptional regulator
MIVLNTVQFNLGFTIMKNNLINFSVFFSIHQATLYRLYNNDVTRIEFDTIDKLCDLLNCAPGDLFVKETVTETSKLQEKTQTE